MRNGTNRICAKDRRVSHESESRGGARLEEVYARNGLTLTDAVNVFFQQSLNTGGFPFPVTEDNAELVKAKALGRLARELQKGDECSELYDAEQAAALLGIVP